MRWLLGAYIELVHRLEMNIRLRDYAINRRSSHVSDAIHEFNRELNSIVIGVTGRVIDGIHTTIESSNLQIESIEPDLSISRYARSREYLLTTHVLIRSTPRQLSFAFEPGPGDLSWLMRFIPGPRDQSRQLGRPFPVDARALDDRLDVVPRFCWPQVRAIDPAPPLQHSTPSPKDAIDWLIMTITTVANAMALGMAAGLSMSPIFIAGRQRYFETSKVWQQYISDLMRSYWVMCSRHGLVLSNRVNCQPCEEEKVELELLMLWLKQVCRVILKLVWEQASSATCRGLLIELENAKVIAEDVYDDTRYQLLELS